MSGDAITAAGDLIDHAAPIAAERGRRAIGAPLSDDSRVAVEVRGLVERGQMDEARERFAELVTLHQRRASRIAYQYLRDAGEADEAVQDAFVDAVSSWPRDGVPANPAAWISTTARRRAIDLMRRAQAQHHRAPRACL